MICAQPRDGLQAEIITALSPHKPARGLRRTTLAGGAIALRLKTVIHWPDEIKDRQVPGLWEAGLIKGAFNRSTVSTLVERKPTISLSAKCLAAPPTRRWKASPAR